MATYALLRLPPCNKALNAGKYLYASQCRLFLFTTAYLELLVQAIKNLFIVIGK